MPEFRQFVRSFRPAILVVLGAIVGAGVAPAMAGAHSSLQIASMQTRSASCQGLNFHPVDSSTSYNFQGVELYRDKDLAGSGFFVCDPGLPNGAVVKRVQFTLLDADNGAAQRCGLWRSSLAPSTATTYQPIAELPSSDTATAGGPMRLSSSSITNATVDNTHFAYWLQCQLTDNSYHLGIYGADVIYAISSVNG